MGAGVGEGIGFGFGVGVGVAVGVGALVPTTTVWKAYSTSSGGAPDATIWVASALVCEVGAWPPTVEKSAFTYALTPTPWRCPVRTMWKSRLRVALPRGRLNMVRAVLSSDGVGARPKYLRYMVVTTATRLEALTLAAREACPASASLVRICTSTVWPFSGRACSLPIEGEATCKSGVSTNRAERSVLILQPGS